MSVGSGTSTPASEILEPESTAATPSEEVWQKRIDGFVGREAEMATLRTRIDEANNGKGSLVLISGEPGIGKTRLLTEASHYAEANDMQVLWGRCWEGEGAPAFWPWIQVLRSLAVFGGSAAANDLGPKTDAVLKRLSASSEINESRVDSSAQFQLFDAISEVLRIAARARHLVLFLDDLHQADPSSIRVLEFFLTELRQTPASIIASVRSLEGPTTPNTLVGRLAADPHTQSMALEGLREEAVRQLIQAQLDGTSISKSELQRIGRRTEGNPFFLLEICRTIRGRRELDLPETLDVPGSARALLENWVGNLSDEGRRVLNLAAVIGRTFSVDLLTRLVGNPFDTNVHLHRAEATGLISPTQTPRGECQFSHAIIREFFYGQCSAEERALLHQRVAEEIERVSGEQVEDFADALAHHYFCARHLAPSGKALHYTLKASTYASSTAAYDYAAELLRRALTIAEGENTRRVDIFLGLGSALLSAGRWHESQQAFLEAARIARMIDLPDRFAKAAIGAKGLILSPAPPDQHSIDLLLEALRKLPESETQLRVQVLHALATATHFSPPQSSHANLAKEALDLAESLDKVDAIATALEAIIMTHLRPGKATQMIEYSKRLLTLGQESRNTELQGKARIHLYLARTQHADTTSNAELDIAEKLALETNHPKLRWQVCLLRSSQSIVRGDLDSGLEYAHTARQLGNRCHDQTAFLHLGLNLLLRARLCGSFDHSENFIRAGAKLTPDVPLSKLPVHCADFASDPTAPRQRALEETMDACSDYLHTNSYSLWSQCLMAELAFLTDNRVVSERLIKTLEPYADEAVIAGWGTAMEGSAAHFLGLCYLSIGQINRSVELFKKAVQVNSECNWGLLRGRSELSLGLALLKTSSGAKVAEAVTHARIGKKLFERVGIDYSKNPFIVGDDNSPISHAFHELLNEGISRKSVVNERRLVATAAEDGEFMSFSYDGCSVSIRVTKGARQLVWLIANPGTDVLASVLAKIDLPVPQWGAPSSSRAAKVKVIDDQAQADYSQRVREIRALLEVAPDNPESQLELREELRWLTETISKSKNLWGRTRYLGDPDERARVGVRNNLSNAINRIHRQNETIGTHLMNSIRTGSVCSYRPEPIANRRNSRYQD